MYLNSVRRREGGAMVVGKGFRLFVGDTYMKARQPLQYKSTIRTYTYLTSLAGRDASESAIQLAES